MMGDCIFLFQFSRDVHLLMSNASSAHNIAPPNNETIDIAESDRKVVALAVNRHYLPLLKPLSATLVEVCSY